MSPNLQRISATQWVLAAPQTGSFRPGSPSRAWRLSAFYARVILGLLLSTSVGVSVAQDVETGSQDHAKAAPGFHNRKKHKHAASGPADPFWDLNGTAAGAGGTGGTMPNGTWSTSVANWNPLSDGTGTTAVWNNGDAAVFSAGSTATGNYTVTVSGSVTASSITFEEGTVTLAGTSTPVLTISGGITINNTINGTTTFGSSLGTILTPTNASQIWANNSTQGFVVNSGVQLGGKVVLTLGGSGSGTISGIISQASAMGANQGALAKTGAGTFTLTGANTYGGASNGTTVSAGTLLVNNTTGSGTGAGAVTVNNTGTLGGSGTITGTVTLNNSGVINGGGTAGAVGTLTINNGTVGALTFNNTSVLNADMTATTADQISVIGGVNIATTTAVLQLNIPNGTTFAAGQQFTLLNNDAADAITGTFSNAPTGMDIINGYAWVVSYTGGSGNDFVLTAVPEPGTWLAGGLAVAGLICYQRRCFGRFFKRAKEERS